MEPKCISFIQFWAYGFPLKSKTINLNQFLVRIIRHSFRKTQWRDFEKNQKLLILGPKNTPFSLIWHNKNPRLSLLPTSECLPSGKLFRHIIWIKLKKSPKVFDFGSKMPLLPHFGHNKIFSQKKGFTRFLCLLNPIAMQKKNWRK